MRLKEIIVGAAVAGGLAAGALGLTTATAGADPSAATTCTGPADGDADGGTGPARGTEPRQRAVVGAAQAGRSGVGHRQQAGLGAGWQHWGVWMNGVFIPTY